MYVKRKLQIITLFLLSCTVLLVAACQPTPDKAAVVNKGNGELENKVKESAQSSGSNTAQKGNRVVWEEKKTVNIEDNDDYTVNVKMDAQMPKLPDKASVYLIEPKEFSIDSMKKAAEYLMKGEIYDGKESKEDVTNEILALKKDVGSHTLKEKSQENVDIILKDWNKEYSSAPDGNAEANYKYIKQSDGTRGLHLKSYTDDKNILDFYAGQGVATGLIDFFVFRIDDHDNVFQYIGKISGPDIQASGTKTTYKQAFAEVNKAVNDLFDVKFDMVHSNIIDKINSNESFWNDNEDGTSLGQAYVFYYTRDYDGFPSLYIKDAPIYATDKTEYAAPYPREGFYIVVDDRGIDEIWYDSYSNTIKTLNQNVKLMPFDNILDKFKDGVFYHNLWGGSGTLAKINITGIDFGMVREPVKDNKNQYMMVPAWNFTGSISSGGAVIGQDVSMLALNAIDGGIITDYDCVADPK